MRYQSLFITATSALLLVGCLDSSDENLPPAAQDGIFNITVDNTLNAELDAYDGNSDQLSFAIEQGVESGELTLNEDGSFSYQPPAEFVGEVGFTYSVTDGEFSDQGTALIVVEAEQVAASFYVREAYSQPADAEPLPINGRVIMDDVDSTAEFADLVNDGGS